MKQQRRFIKSIVKTAKTTDVRMPWERGAPRAAMQNRRKAPMMLKRA